MTGDVSIRPGSNIQYINLNAFIACLSSSNTGVISVGDIFTGMLDDDDIRNNRVIFNVFVSAVAQYIIYSASRVLILQMRSSKNHRGFLEWQKWKKGFEEAQTNTIIATNAKKRC